MKHLRDVPIETLGGGGTVDVLLGLDAAALMVPMEVRRGGAMETICREDTAGGGLLRAQSRHMAMQGTEKTRLSGTCVGS